MNYHDAQSGIEENLSPAEMEEWNGSVESIQSEYIAIAQEDGPVAAAEQFRA